MDMVRHTSGRAPWRHLCCYSAWYTLDSNNSAKNWLCIGSHSFDDLLSIAKLHHSKRIGIYPCLVQSSKRKRKKRTKLNLLKKRQSKKWMSTMWLKNNEITWATTASTMKTAKSFAILLVLFSQVPLRREKTVYRTSSIHGLFIAIVPNRKQILFNVFHFKLKMIHIAEFLLAEISVANKLNFLSFSLIKK